MLKHPSRQWTWGRFVLVFPKANPGFTGVAARYGDILRDRSTFEVRAIEELASAAVLGAEVARAFCERYL
jgi:hypothetical protein